MADLCTKLGICFFINYFLLVSFFPHVLGEFSSFDRKVKYSGYRLRINKAVTTVTFSLFQPSFQRISGTKDTSFESLNTGRLEFAQKLGVASCWGWPRPLTEKALLLLELVWSLSWQRFFQFQNFFQTAHYRALFWGI